MNIIYKITYEGKIHLVLGTMHNNFCLDLIPQHVAEYTPSVTFHNFYTEVSSIWCRATYTVTLMYVFSFSAFTGRSASLLYYNVMPMEAAATVMNADAERPLKHKAAESLWSQWCFPFSFKLLSLVRYGMSFFVQKELDVYNNQAYMFNQGLALFGVTSLFYTGAIALKQGYTLFLVKFLINKLMLDCLVNFIINQNPSDFRESYNRILDYALAQGREIDECDRRSLKEMSGAAYREALYMEPRNHVQANTILAETKNSIFMYGLAHLEAPAPNKSVIDILRDKGAGIEVLVGGKWQNI